MDQDNVLHHNIEIKQDNRKSRAKKFVADARSNEQCPLQFTLGLSRRAHHAPDGKSSAIVEPPSIYPVHPSYGPGRQVIHTSQYEHLDMLTPSQIAEPTVIIREGLMEHHDFPLLFESSSFLGAPLVHDVNGDGIPDAVLADYDGGLYFVGLQVGKDHVRYFHKAQIPRLFLRRDWMTSRLNETAAALKKAMEVPGAEGEDPVDHTNNDHGSNDPYHSYFEYGSQESEDVLRGVTANVLGQDHADLSKLTGRRNRKVNHERPAEEVEDVGDGEELEEVQEDVEQAGEQQVLDEQQERKTEHAPQEEEDVDEEEIASEGGEGNESEGEQTEEEEIEANQDEQVEDEDIETNEEQQEGDSGPEDQETAEQEENITEGEDTNEEEETEEEEDANEEEEEKETGGQEEKEDNGQDFPEEEEDSNEGENTNEMENQEVEESGHINEETAEELNEADHRRLSDEPGSEESDGPGEDNNVDGEKEDGSKYDGDVGDVGVAGYTDDVMGGESKDWPDDDAGREETDYDGQNYYGDDYDGMMDDEYRHYAGSYDDYYSSHHTHHNDFYDSKHYIRVPPHVLSTPVLADLKKAYSDNELERDELLFVAVSYYFDEDEYEGHFSYKRFHNTDKGDETEMNRGMYLGSALISYVIDSSPRFNREEQFDLSGDPSAPHDVTLVAEIPFSDENKSNMAAFALSPPTVADINGNGDEDVLLGTSMGIIYCLHARHMYATEGWPVQVPHPVESRILVEDVMGDTNLEVFVMDTGGNVYCFDATGRLLWNRDTLNSVEETKSRRDIDTEESQQSEIRGLSTMTMGDVNGDGVIDIVFAMKLVSSSGGWKTLIFAISSTNGNDISNFPMEFVSPLLMDDGSGQSSITQKLPQPLLIDLHADQLHWSAYLYRNGTTWNHPAKPADQKPDKPPNGGTAPGLHIVQPIGSNLYVVEGGSGCAQQISIGEEVSAMVQADDVHGTGNLDLVVSTMSGNIVTLESPGVPYHPLNVWNSGEVRGRRNSFVQGFTASQGIFVHDRSRQYRDIFGVYVPVTFEIFDNRPNIVNEPDKRVYVVEIRDGTSSKRTKFRKVYNEVGVFTENLYIDYGPGYYTLSVLLKTTHGVIYEDIFHLGYNVHYMDGYATLLWLPLCLAAFFIVVCSRKKANWDDEDADVLARGRSQGILGSNSDS